MKTNVLRISAALCVTAALLAVTPPAQAALANKNVYAYGITVTSTDKYKPEVSYKLNGAAKNVKVRAYIDGVQIKEVDGTANATNKVTVDLNDVAASGTVSFSVYAETANPVTTPTQIVDGDMTATGIGFSRPGGVTVNNCPDSPTFGTIIVSEGADGGANHYSQNADNKGRGAMLYAFDPTLTGIVNPHLASSGQHGFSGNIQSNINGQETAFARVKYSDDGRLFLHTASPKLMGLYEIGSKDGEVVSYNGSTAILSGTLTNTTGEIKNGTTYVGGAGWGLDVKGSGENLKVAIGINTAFAATSPLQKVLVYNLGTASTWGNKAPSRTIAATEFNSMIRPYGVNVNLDKDDDGMWVTTYSAQNTAADLGAVHIDADGNVNYNGAGTETFKYAYCVAYNRDRTILAVSNNNTICFYKVTFDASKKPVLTKVAEITNTNFFNQQTTCLAFDYADNVYITNRTKEKFVAYQMPASVAGSTSREVPAPASTSYEITAKNPISLTATKGSWSNKPGVQTSNLSWTAVSGATTYKVYRNGDHLMTVTGATSCTAELKECTLSFPDKDVYTQFHVTADVNGNTLSSGIVDVFYAGFGTIAAPSVASSQSPENGNVAVVTWSAPKVNGVLLPATDFRVYCADDEESAGEIVADVTADGSDTYTATVRNLSNGQHYFYVTADMSIKIRTSASKVAYTMTGTANRALVAFDPAKTAPYIKTLRAYAGRNSVVIEWEMGKGVNLSDVVYYNIYRDGIMIAEGLDAMQTNDMQVPDGMHEYWVEVVYKDGVKLVSEKKKLDAPIERDQAITQYGIEEIYNYPILDQTTATKLGYDNQTAFITNNYPLVANMYKKDGPWGAKGGLYRSAVYYNGKWFVTQLNDYNVDMAGQPNTIDYNDFSGNGGIIRFNAENILQNDANYPKRMTTLPPSSNQILARGEDVDNSFLYRDVNGVSPTATSTQNYMFYLGLQYIKVGKTGATDPVQSTLTAINNKHNPTGQIGRVHYAAANGTLRDANGGYAYFALNKLNSMFRVPIANQKAGTPQEFNLPDEYVNYTDKSQNQTGSTENYAFPVAGRKNTFIWVNRSNATFLVETDDQGTPANTKYTQILGEKESFNAGGLTFLYNGEIFYIHPTSIRSNNVGHFKIDMPKRASETAGVETADFAEMIPTVAFTQKEITEEAAANTNAVWFGAEVNEDENCVYIYQYVPGMRFAKYRFYSYEDYPAVTPKIEIKTQYNDDKTDITHFNATMTWERPAKYAKVEYKDFKLTHYDVKMLDAKRKVIYADPKFVDPGQKDEGVKFTIPYHQNTIGEKHIDAQTYTLEVTPVYQSLKDATRIIIGETGVATHNNDYEGNIGDAKSRAFHDLSNPSKPIYRIDLDFDRAALEVYPEPVSYFTIEYKKNGTGNWLEVPNLRIHFNGETQASESEPGLPADHPRHNGKISGQYRFGNEPAPAGARQQAPVSTDKCYALYYMHNRPHEEDAFPCVAWHTQSTDPTGNIYRMTAHYAADNSFIRKSYSTETAATLPPSPSTGVNDINAEAAGKVTAFPVPAEGPVTVTAPSAINSIEIYSTAGARVICIDGNDSLSQDIDISALPSGIYLLRVNGLAPIRIVRK